MNDQQNSEWLFLCWLSLRGYNSNSARGDLNEENLLCPPGQRLVQKSGSQLNPLLTPCHRCPAPSHSARGSQEISVRLFSLQTLPEICLARWRSLRKKTSQRLQTRRSAQSAPIRNKYVTLFSAAECTSLFTPSGINLKGRTKSERRIVCEVSGNKWCVEKKKSFFIPLSIWCEFVFTPGKFSASAVLTHQRGRKEISILISTILHVSPWTENISRTNKDNFCPSVWEGAISFASWEKQHYSPAGCIEVKDVGGLVLRWRQIKTLPAILM